MEKRLSKQALKSLKKINEPNKSRLKSAINNLPNGDVKAMKNFNKAYRLRVGNYRIIYYLVDDDVILIDKIGLRGQIYNK